jgi:hypothetical protein
MIKIKMIRIKPLLYWSVWSRMALALFLSLIMWTLVLEIIRSS